MERIVLTGGIASGKSTVTRYLKSRGEIVLDADQQYHEMVAKPSSLTAKIGARFGDVLTSDGAVDRQKLARLVLSDGDALCALNAMTHPLVFAALSEAAEAWEGKGAKRLFFDIPLYYEAQEEAETLHADAVWVVDVSESVQRTRLMAREHISAGEAQCRMAIQMPLDEKAEQASVVIHNDGTYEELVAQIDALL